MMSDLHDVLVGLVGMDPDQRRLTMTEHRTSLFTDTFVAFVQREQQRALHHSVNEDEWKGIPAVLTEAFSDGLKIWEEQVQAVCSDMIEVAQALADAIPDSPPAAIPTRHTPAGSTTPTAPSGPVPSTFVNSSPTEEEIHQDFVDWDRRQYDNLQDDVEFNRVRDDAIDYSTPSYDSYDSYDY